MSRRIQSCVAIDGSHCGVSVMPLQTKPSSSSASSSSVLSFRPLMTIEGLSRKSFTYDKLPPEPIKLSVLKLDGSSFDVCVMGTATIKELKEAVENAFGHMPQKGPGKISWRHVWGHFCLCYDGKKLLTETDLIMNYGIKDGDQLRIVRHISSNHVMEKNRSSRRISFSRQRRKSLSRCGSGEAVHVNNKAYEDDGWDLEKGRTEDYRKHKDSTGHRELGSAKIPRGGSSRCSELSSWGDNGATMGKDQTRQCQRALWGRIWKFMMFFGEKARTA